MSEPNKQHPDVVAWYDWLRSAEGLNAAQGTAEGGYLENRLWRAFMAGILAGRQNALPIVKVPAALSAPYDLSEQNKQHGIGWAIKHMQFGCHVTRAGWNGKNMWLALQRPTMESKMSLPYIYMHTADGNLVPWLASQTDILAVDWAGVL